MVSITWLGPYQDIDRFNVGFGQTTTRLYPPGHAFHQDSSKIVQVHADVQTNFQECMKYQKVILDQY